MPIIWTDDETEPLGAEHTPESGLSEPTMFDCWLAIAWILFVAWLAW